MKNYYQAKLKVAQTNDEGILKQVTRQIMVHAISYTDAETSVHKHMEEQCAPHGWSLESLSKTNISEIIGAGESDIYHKAKVLYCTVDADNGKEVKVTSYLLVDSETVADSIEHIDRHMDKILVPYTIPTVTKTNIEEVVEMGEVES